MSTYVYNVVISLIPKKKSVSFNKEVVASFYVENSAGDNYESIVENLKLKEVFQSFGLLQSDIEVQIIKVHVTNQDSLSDLYDFLNRCIKRSVLIEQAKYVNENIPTSHGLTIVNPNIRSEHRTFNTNPESKWGSKWTFGTNPESKDSNTSPGTDLKKIGFSLSEK